MTMKKPKIAILSFPGNNGDIENLRTFKRCGFDTFVFRWNDSKEKMAGTDGYFIGAGFSYEDRGRAGMVAARDPLFQFLHEEDKKGKVIVGHCNGCQMLIESGLVPLGNGLKMCMSRNAVENKAIGFINEWVWITPTCKKERCAASNWEGTIQAPIAHGEGRFVTKDPDLIEELRKNDQIAFSYCDQDGNVSAEAPVTPNGSTIGIAGICNQAGNVVAIMPHTERTKNGDPYFLSIRKWLESDRKIPAENTAESLSWFSGDISRKKERPVEIFIDTIIVNNEERTVELAARRYVPGLNLKQYRYLSPAEDKVKFILTTISLFNPNKEIAYIRRGSMFSIWNHDLKTENKTENIMNNKTCFIRRDDPDTGAAVLGENSETGICYACSEVKKTELLNKDVLEIFHNPHGSTLELLY